MTTYILERIPPVALLCQWLCGKGRGTVHSAPSPALRNDRADGTITLPTFILLSPVPISARLSVDLVPERCWCAHVRDRVSQQQWDQVRRQTHWHAHNRCAIGGGQGPEWPVERHAVWHDDDTNLVQTSTRLIALCPACHWTKHLGLAEVKGRLAAARSHVAQINGWTGAETAAYLAPVWQLWEEPSTLEWRLNLSWPDRWQSFAQSKR
jgi:hypothetical protein